MWTFISKIVTLDCKWISLIGEKWLDSNGRELEYWRTVSADSVIIIPEQTGEFLLPEKTFRPGVGFETLDFPGGRLTADKPPDHMAIEILDRELGIPGHSIKQLIPIYEKPKLVNSSSSNQKLFGFYALIDASPEDKFLPHFRFSAGNIGVNDLLQELECLQCRALLLELLRIKDSL